MRKLWYKNEAKFWNEALPIGNGRIGGMVFSGVLSDKIQINEDTLWSGYPNKCTKKHSVDEILEIRKLVNEKKYYEATQKTSESMFDVHSDSYVPYGNLYIDFITEACEVRDYRRELDLETGIVKTTYNLNGVDVTKEVFVSLKDDCLVMNVKSSERLNIHVYEAVDLENSVKMKNSAITVTGRCPTDVSMYTNTVEYNENLESIHYCSHTGFITEDHVYGGGNSLWSETKDLTIIFSIKTSFNGYNKMPVSEGKEYINGSEKALHNAKKYSYDELKKRHRSEYQKYFNRVSLEIKGEDYSHIPTDERIKNAGEGTVDNGLITLLFDFGRYLTIAASQPGTQPANLQGIWSDRLIAPWHSNYTMNINTQMNYWPIEVCDLPECHEPLFKMLKEFSEKGNTFGFKGWSAWHNSDIWRFHHEATTGVLWGYWQMGGFWSLRHLWEHYLHTRDKSFLEEYYPVMTGACEFLEDWMFENEKGELTTCPSTSPENEFIYEEKSCAVCDGSAMDIGIIYDVFDKTAKASEVLGRDSRHYKEILRKLKPIKIGKDGRVLEWGEEFKEKELGHRHISHLYYLFPSDILISKEYEDAAKETLRVRLENGGGHTGWSNAWIANFYARLKDGESAMYHIRNMFKQSIYGNMFDKHPPFQIDGNFGITSAICEMLVQSHTGETEFLPAIPKEWESGKVMGLKTRDGKTVDFEWNQNGVKME